MDVSDMIARLRREKEEIERAIVELERQISATPREPGNPTPYWMRRSMSLGNGDPSPGGEPA
jgi:hypothetical protein